MSSPSKSRNDRKLDEEIETLHRLAGTRGHRRRNDRKLDEEIETRTGK